MNRLTEILSAIIRNYKIKDRVIAIVENEYYIGVITKISRTKAFIIFDDNDKLSVPIKDIKARTLKTRKSAIPKAKLKDFIFKRNSVAKISLAKLKKDPDNYVYGLSIKQLAFIIKESKERYYNSDKPLIDDDTYDIIEDELKQRSPKHPALQTGADVPVDRVGKVKLPFPMGSLDKVKPGTKALDKFIEDFEGPYVLSDKLDGQSLALIGTKSGWQLYTRGNGSIGQDVSHLVPFLKLPKAKVGIQARAEFIMPEAKFKKLFPKGVNARNSVSGLLNKDNVDANILKSVDIICYQLIKPKVKPSSQFKKLKALGLKVAKHKLVKTIDDSMLSKYYENRRKTSKIAIDGIVITDDDIYNVPKSGNPSYSKAFKMQLASLMVETTVLKIEWTASRHGYWKPVILVKPVKVSGVTVSRVSGFNYKFIKENGLGPKAIIRISRSGDVIPDLRSKDVIKKVKPQLPIGKYYISDSGVDAILIDAKNNDTVKIKMLTSFFRGIGVEDFSGGLVERLYDDGLNTIMKIVKATETRLMKIDGIQSRMANKIVTNIEDSLESVDLPTLMYASGIFGRDLGSRRLRLITNKYDIFEEDLEMDDILSIKGYSETLANYYLSNIDKFLKWYSKIEPYVTLEEIEIIKPTGTKLKDMKILLTGVRDKEVSDFIISNGGELASGMTKSVNLLIVKDAGYSNKKTDKASELGTTVLTIKQFRNKYL